MVLFVPSEFVVPTGFETDMFRARMLSVNDVVKDFEAVCQSAPLLQRMFPTWRGWPKGLTIEQNLIDLGWHQKEFQLRRSFAYTIVSLDEKTVLGCVYVEPTQRADYDAEVYFWARETKIGGAADKALAQAILPWIEREWPFERVAYPGRNPSWDDWAKLPPKNRADEA